jgi:hypothetical protein
LKRDRDIEKPPVISASTWIWCQRSKSKLLLKWFYLFCCCSFIFFDSISFSHFYSIFYFILFFLSLSPFLFSI